MADSFLDRPAGAPSLDALLRKLPKAAPSGGEEIASGLAYRELTLDQMARVVGGLMGGTCGDHTCGTVTSAAGEDACDAGAE